MVHVTVAHAQKAHAHVFAGCCGCCFRFWFRYRCRGSPVLGITTYTTVENRYSSTKNIYVLHNIYNDIQTAGLCGDGAATAAITLQPEKEHELNYYGSKMCV